MTRIDPSLVKVRPRGAAKWAFAAIVASLGLITGRCDACFSIHTGATFRVESRRWSTTRSSPETRKQQQQQQQQQALPSYFVIPPTNYTSTAKDWQSLCPPVWNPKQNKDASLFWSCCDDSEQAATALLRQLDPMMHPNPRRIATLAQSMQQFRDFCSDHLQSPHPGHGMTFKARIVATRGLSGTKCPQWHVDHVPVRWIQSLVGPGCEMVVGNVQQGIEWDLINGLNEKAEREEEDDDDDDNDDVVAMSVQDRNQVLVKDQIAQIYHGKEMEALLLIGNRWTDYAKESTFVPPVVHKSPTIPWGCERVLLTQDVILDD